MSRKKKRERQKRISRRGEFGRGNGARMLQEKPKKIKPKKKPSTDRMENFAQREREREEGGDMEEGSTQTVNCKIS